MANAYANTFLWHDYETWGINPAFNGPAQFAAIRTDSELNPIEEMMFYCQPPKDALPQPEACLVTGISPQKAQLEGFVEAEFCQKIYQAMIKPNTCSVGYNSMRFDDEVTRFMLYRNFYDAYQREWQNGNSRWDLIDVVRLCAALRPEGIVWPKGDNGAPSYRLEALTAANGIEHAGAHDALVDVRATIALAKLIKDKQGKLFDYALSLRDKRVVASKLQLGSGKPVFHISAMFGNQNYCASVLLPLCMHPSNNNAVICYDLRYAPEAFLAMDAEQIKAQLFSKKEVLDDKNVYLKNIHLNKSPMIAPVSMLDDATAARIGLDLAQVQSHYQSLHAALDEALQNKVQQVFNDALMIDAAGNDDVDAGLYSGGFFSNYDKDLMGQIVKSSPEALAQKTWAFQDARLPEMLFRYRARNFPDSLNAEESTRWQAHCMQRIMQPNQKALISAEAYQEKLEQYFMQYQEDEIKSQLLGDLFDWLDQLMA